MFATPSDPEGAAPRPMSNEEMLTRQLELHQQIQKQMEMQMEMTRQFNRRQPLASPLSSVEPDLGDSVFDMLDDLIVIPSGKERNSLSKNPLMMGSDMNQGEDDEDDSNAHPSHNGGSSSRDSLADIMESLDMDLDDFEFEDYSASKAHMTASSQGRDSLDETASVDTLDADLDMEDLSGDVVDHGVDDEDELDSSIVSYVESSVLDDSSVPMLQRQRLSSSDMLSSVSSRGSISQSGHYCTLIWEDGLLGLRLRMSQSKMVPAVSKITGRSSILGIHLVDVGDLLVEIAGHATREMEFMEAINFLKEVPKPCKLVFKRLSSDPMIVKTVQPPVKSEIALKLAKKIEELANQELEKAPIPPAVRLDAKYEVQWLDGPLGISLIASKDVPYPLVTRITGKNRSPQVQEVQPGHYLLQIGSYNTAEGNFNTAIKYLQKVPKPVALVFCPGQKDTSLRPEPTADEYDHVWEKKQPLCFTVRADAHGRMAVADLGSAKSLKVKVKGNASLAMYVASGDYITWINDECTKEMSFHEALLKLRTAKRPLIIRFRKADDEPTSQQPTPSPLPVLQEPAATPSPVPPPAPAPAAVPNTKPPSKSFNPLKKLATLGSSGKENSPSVGNQNQKSLDLRKQLSPWGSSEPSGSRKNVFGAEIEVKRTSNDIPSSVPTLAKRSGSDASSSANNVAKRSSSDASSSVASALKRTSSDTSSSAASSQAYPSSNSILTSNSTPVEQRRPEQSSKILNLDSISGIRLQKAPIVKSTSDPVLGDNERVQNSQVKPITRSNRNSRENSTSDDSRGVSPSGSGGSDKSSEEYEVVWPEGTSLGLTLRVHPTTRFPVVARVTGTSNLKNIEHVCPGDILFAANNVPIIPQPKFKQTLENLSRLPKPAVLRFRRAQSAGASQSRAEESDAHLQRGPPLKENEFEVIWRESMNLGLVFSADVNGPRVTKIDVESGGPSISKVRLGDTLTYIGSMSISALPFHTSMATLRATKRPVVLRFRR